MSGYRGATGNHPAFPRTELDAAAAERLLASEAEAGQAEHPQLAALLSAAAASPPPGPVPGEDAVLAAFRAEMHGRSRTHRRAKSVHPAKARLLALALGGGFVVCGSVAAAATGSLPGPVQDTARDVLGRFNIDVPSSDGRTEDEPAQVGPDDGNPGPTQAPDQGDDGSGTPPTAETGEVPGGGPTDAARNDGDRRGDGQGNRPSTTPTPTTAPTPTTTRTPPTDSPTPDPRDPSISPQTPDTPAEEIGNG